MIFVRFPSSMDLIIHYNVHWKKINEETKELNITRVTSESMQQFATIVGETQITQPLNKEANVK